MSVQDESTTAEVVPSWQPESPFLLDPSPAREAPLAPSAAFSAAPELESPFLSQYAFEAGGGAASPAAERFAQLMSELYDRELEEALTDLVNEAGALAEDRFARESGDSARDRAAAERDVREYLAPLARETEAMLDRLVQEAGSRDVSKMTAAEVDRLFEAARPDAAMESPAFEGFLKGLWNKAKRAVKAVAKVVGKVVPLDAIMSKLKPLVRPLLERVLRFAMDKLPVALRPIAAQLASKFLGVSVPSEAEARDVRSDSLAAADPATIQEEVDARFVGSVLAGEDFERDADAVRFAEVQSEAAIDPLRELEDAREQFARDVAALRPGQDPRPAVENFIPAILAAAKVAIGVIGRERVVGFLAGLVSKLISRFIGPEAATALSRSLVDTGLRLVSLETTPETERLAAGYTVASTVEDTVNRLVADTPAEAWQSEAALEAYALEAFEEAAAANFPDSAIRPDLRESAGQPGAWVMMPVQGRRKRYKKYTRVIETTVTPQMAEWIRTFGGTRLSSVLRGRYGIAPAAPVTVRLHLYEAIWGTTLSHIAFHEKGLAGLGNARRSAWTLIHPLTPCTAGLLFREPGLAVDVPDRFTSDRNLVQVGQRFYFLELPGVTPRPLASARPDPGVQPAGPMGEESSSTRVVLDFPRGQLRVFVHYAEQDAQQLKMALQKKSASAIPALLTAGLDASLRAVFKGGAPKRLRVVHEAVPTQQFLAGAAATVLEMVAAKLVDWIVDWALKALQAELERGYKQFVERFGKAADDPARGVTLVLVFNGPAFFEGLRKVVTAPGGTLPGVGTLLQLRAAIASATVELKPGAQYW